MKNSRTSTNNTLKKKVGTSSAKKRVSTSPSSTNLKKKTTTIQKKKLSSSASKSLKKAVQTKKKTSDIELLKKQGIKSKKKIQPAETKVKKKVISKTKSNVKRDNRDVKNNIRLNKTGQDVDYVPFLDDEQPIKPNNVRKVEPEEEYEEVERENILSKIHIKPKIILEITFFVTIIVVIGYMAFNLEAFNLTEVKVKGNEKYTEQEIINKSTLKVGENVFKQILDSKNRHIGLSYVADVDLVYTIPSTITIKVKERYPAYIAKDKKTSKCYMIDNDGYLLEECELSEKHDELYIEGFVFEEAPEFGKKINEVYLQRLETYNKIKELIEKIELKGNITKVNFSNSLTTITLDDKLNIVWDNNSNLDYKATFLKGIIQKNGEIVEGTIDMSVDNPVYSKYN